MEAVNKQTDVRMPKTAEGVYKEQESYFFPDGLDAGRQEENRVITCEFYEYTKAQIEGCNGNLAFYESSYNRYLYSLYPGDTAAYIDIEAEKRLDAFQNRVDERIEACEAQGSYAVRENGPKSTVPAMDIWSAVKAIGMQKKSISWPGTYTVIQPLRTPYLISMPLLR